MAPHVAYEIHMLEAMIEAVDRYDSPSSDDRAEQKMNHKAHIESLLTHARTLDEFLGRPVRHYDTDLLATDYIEEWQPFPLLTPRERTDINSRLAHLSTARLDPRPDWELELGTRILRRCGDFTEAIRSAPCAPWFHRPRPENGPELDKQGPFGPTRSSTGRERP
jgi:hypothetical protein